MEHVHYSKDDHRDYRKTMDDWQREWEEKHPISHICQKIVIKILKIFE